MCDAIAVPSHVRSRLFEFHDQEHSENKLSKRRLDAGPGVCLHCVVFVRQRHFTRVESRRAEPQDLADRS